MKPDAEIRAIQARADKLLPSVVPKTFDRPVSVLVRRGKPEGIALVQLSSPARGGVEDYERSQTRSRGAEVALLTRWTDLALADFLANAVGQLLQREP